MTPIWVQRFVRAVSFVAGLLLLFAAVAKLREGLVGAVRLPWFTDDSSAQLLIVVAIESALGLWLTSHWRPRMARWAGALFFSLLAIVSIQLIAAGQSTCGCFGRIPLRPEGALLLDVVVIGLLLTAALLSRRIESKSSTVAPLPFATWMAGGIAIIALLLSTWMAVTSQRLDDVIGRLRGDDVTISPRIKDLGMGSRGQGARYQVALTNHTTQPVTIVGTSANCSCALDVDLPFVVPPRTSQSLTVTVRFAGSAGRFKQGFTLYLSSERQTSLPVRFVGDVTSSSPQPNQSLTKK